MEEHRVQEEKERGLDQPEVRMASLDTLYEYRSSRVYEFHLIGIILHIHIKFSGGATALATGQLGSATSSPASSPAQSANLQKR